MNSIYARMAIYILSPVLSAVAAASTGLVAYDATTHVLSLQVDGVLALIGTAVTGGGILSAAVFKRWGVK